jgi:hypothetical protein
LLRQPCVPITYRDTYACISCSGSAQRNITQTLPNRVCCSREKELSVHGGWSQFRELFWESRRLQKIEGTYSHNTYKDLGVFQPWLHMEITREL